MFDPHTEQMHVDGNKALIYAHLTDLLAPVSGRMDAPGRQGYVPGARIRRAAQVPQGDAPARTVAQDDIRGATATGSPDGAIYEFRVRRTAPTTGVPGIYNGGMRVEATVPNLQGIGGGVSTLAVQCKHCHDHSGHASFDPAEVDEWVTVAEDYNQSPVYLQAGLVATANRPQSTYRGDDGRAHQVPWRAVVEVQGVVSQLTAKIDVDFTSGPASSDGDTNGDAPPVLRGYDVANTDFFADLNAFIPDAGDRFSAIDPARVLAGEQSLHGLRNLVLATTRCRATPGPSWASSGRRARRPRTARSRTPSPPRTARARTRACAATPAGRRPRDGDVGRQRRARRAARARARDRRRGRARRRAHPHRRVAAAAAQHDGRPPARPRALRGHLHRLHPGVQPARHRVLGHARRGAGGRADHDGDGRARARGPAGAPAGHGRRGRHGGAAGDHDAFRRPAAPAR